MTNGHWFVVFLCPFLFLSNVSYNWVKRRRIHAVVTNTLSITEIRQPLKIKCNVLHLYFEDRFQPAYLEVIGEGLPSAVYLQQFSLVTGRMMMMIVSYILGAKCTFLRIAGCHRVSMGNCGSTWRTEEEVFIL